MLTIKQINEVSFRKSSFSGYKPEDVDDFIDEVSESFVALVKENQMLKSKASELSSKNIEMREKLVVLAEKIEAYRDDEDGIKNVLLSAQKLGSASIKEAKVKADSIISEANTKANEMIVEANKKTTAVIESYQNKIVKKEKEFDAIKSSVTTFRSSLYDIYRNHLNAIESIPDFSNELKSKDVENVVEAHEQPTKMPTQSNNTQPTQPTEVLAQSNNIQPTEALAHSNNEMQSVLEVDEVDEMGGADDIINDIIRPNYKANAFPLADKEVLEDAYEPESLPIETFDEIDFNAYSDIPDVLKNDKAALYSTLEFGEDVDLRKKK